MPLTYYEMPHPGMRLGRHLELDGRSLAYLADVARVIKPAEWLPAIPTLDQGNVGSCTGNAGTYALSSLYGVVYQATPVVLEGHQLSETDADQNEQFALALYHEATVKDGFAGTYPPDDTGSSGLGVCRALKAAKLVSSYRWAVTLHGLASFLQRGGCIIGTPWYEAWFSPDPDGFIDADPNWNASGVAGGHELYVEALESWQDDDPGHSVIRFHNSWGDSWGDHGRGRMRLSTYLALKNQIDVKQLEVAAA